MIEIDRKELALMMECGYIMVGMQRFEQARDVFQGIAVLAPESEIPIVALGSVAFCEGKFKEAMRWYQKALQLVPESLFAKAYLGEALFFDGNTPAATEQLQAVTATNAASKAGIFAKSLLDAIAQGFTPETLSGVEDLKEYRRQQATRGEHAK